MTGKAVKIKRSVSKKVPRGQFLARLQQVALKGEVANFKIIPETSSFMICYESKAALVDAIGGSLSAFARSMQKYLFTKVSRQNKYVHEKFGPDSDPKLFRRKQQA